MSSFIYHLIILTDHLLRMYYLQIFLLFPFLIIMLMLVNNISMRAFRRANINSFSKRLVIEGGNIKLLILKILYLRSISQKALMLSLSLNLVSIWRYISVSFFSFLNRFYKLHFLFYSFYNRSSASQLYRLYLCNICFFNSSRLPLLCYLRYISYSRYLLAYSFYFLASSLVSRLSTGVASLPTHIKKFTVLRSPHSDKKSREQFELRTHKRVLSFPSFFSSFFRYTIFQQSSLCASTHTRYLIKHDSF